MKLINGIVITAFFSLLVGTSTCFAVDYFGYFAIVLPEAGGDHQSEVADHSNVVWIHNQGNTTALINSLNTAAQSGKKAIVSLTPLFQNGDGSFNTNWPANWTWWVSILTPYLDTIVAFYPMDEPHSDRLSMANGTIMVNAIRAAFPGKPIAAIYAYHADSNMSLFDWVGLDCYSQGLFLCNGTGYTFAYADMRASLRADQRIILVPQAGYPISSAGCCDSQLIQEADRFHGLAYGDPKVIGIFPFIWENFPGWYGLQNNPALQPTWKKIGKETSEHWLYPSNVRPLYRFRNSQTNNWFIAKDVTEGIIAARVNGFAFQGIGFEVYTTQQPGMAPLYRCRTSSSHFLSVHSNCESFILEETLGYMQTSQVSGTIPLYRFVSTFNSTHLSTTKFQEGTNLGLQYEGIQGYVPDAMLVPPGC